MKGEDNKRGEAGRNTVLQHSRAMLSATLAAAFAVLPGYLVGATGVFLRPDLGLDESALGIAVAVFFVATGIASPVGGRLADRVGPHKALWFSSLGTAGSLAAVALWATSLGTLLFPLIAAGMANGLGQPTTNLILAQQVHSRQGLMFGVKTSAVPGATLMAGLAIPSIGVTLGWRWMFVTAALAALLVPLIGGHFARPTMSVQTRIGDVPKSSQLWALAFAAGCGLTATTAMGAFLVEWSVRFGLSLSSAGTLQVAASLAGIGARLLLGWLADRGFRSDLRVAALMMVWGGSGFVLLGYAPTVAFMVLGVLAGYAFGWGWNGLLMLAVVRGHPGRPAGATGLVMVGGSAGSAVGPLVFGYLAAGHSFRLAWVTMGCLAASGAAVLAHTDRRLRRSGP